MLGYPGPSLPPPKDPPLQGAKRGCRCQGVRLGTPRGPTTGHLPAGGRAPPKKGAHGTWPLTSHFLCWMGANQGGPEDDRARGLGTGAQRGMHVKGVCDTVGGALRRGGGGAFG